MNQPTPPSYASQGYPGYPQYEDQAAHPYPNQANAPAAGPPPANAGWAVATIVCFWPLAFAAFKHLHNIYPMWAMGDLQGAQEASDRVRSLGKIALWIVIAWVLFFFVMYGAIFAIALSAASAGSR